MLLVFGFRVFVTPGLKTGRRYGSLQQQSSNIIPLTR
jgi:hypothetical protein